jgi:hypothetical protein
VQAALHLADRFSKRLYRSTTRRTCTDDEADEGERRKGAVCQKRDAEVKPAPDAGLRQLFEQVMTETLKSLRTAAVLMPGQMMLAVTVFGAATFSSAACANVLLVRTPSLVDAAISSSPPSFSAWSAGILVNRLSGAASFHGDIHDDGAIRFV